jgi:hypothetical protein
MMWKSRDVGMARSFTAAGLEMDALDRRLALAQRKQRNSLVLMVYYELFLLLSIASDVKIELHG